MQIELFNGNCMDQMLFMADNSVDSIVTDPPYGLSFMGKKWDYDVPSVEIWAECLRVLKPGGHLLAFAGTRTQHRMAVRIEDAGFEIRDMIAWVYGSGFPKSLDVSKAIDGKLTTGRSDSIALREVNETRPGEATVRTQSQNGHAGFVGSGSVGPSVKRDTPATEAARQWQGWGTAMKPALEPVTVARKPLVGTVAANVLAHGTGALNIDGCRVAGEVPVFTHKSQPSENCYGDGLHGSARTGAVSTVGRWPANLIHDGSDDVLAAFPEAKGQQGDLKGHNKERESPNGCFGKMAPAKDHAARIESDTSAARFFYCAKASKKDRGEGNTHPTVKPTDLMRYLCRLVTPPGGIVFDPFMGSGSTGRAALLEGFNFVGAEMDEAFFSIAKARISAVQQGGD